MKKTNLYSAIVMASAVSLVSLSSAHDQGHSAKQSSDIFSGMHITGALGHSRLDGKMDTSYTTNSGNGFLRGSQDNNSNGLAFSGAMDYWAVFKKLSLGTELSVAYSGQETRSQRNMRVLTALLPALEKLKMGYNARFDVLVGRALNQNVFLYGGVGIGFTGFRYKAASVGHHISKTKNLLGFTPSAGLKVKLSSSMLLDLRYQYTVHKSFHVDAPLNGGQIRGQIKPRSSALMMGLSVKL